MTPLPAREQRPARLRESSDPSGASVDASVGCKKVRYRTKRAAHAALDLIADKPNPVGSKRPVRSYRCPHCKGWHLTSSVWRKR